MTGAAGLGARDYERVFAVLEACEDAADLGQFRRAVVDAVQHAFGVQGVTFFTGDSVADAFRDAAPATTGDPSGEILGDYLRSWNTSDVFATPAALQRLQDTGGVCLDELPPPPEAAARYVEQFLHRAGLQSCNAFTFSMGSHRHGLVGLFDPDPAAVCARDASTMRLLCRRLRVVSRALPGFQPNPLATLTNRQREVVVLLSRGLTNARIAAELVLTEDTVKKYVSRALDSTGCRSRTELALLAAHREDPRETRHNRR